MKKYILIIVTLFIVSCNTNKKIQLTQLEDKKVEIFFIDYGDTQQCSIYLRKKIKLKNPYLWFAKMRMYYSVDRDIIEDIRSYPMDYGEDGNLYFIATEGVELWGGEIEIRPLSEREIIYEINLFKDFFQFTGIYKSLEQYVPLAKHPLEENGLTGEKYENKRVLRYEESFSEFKRKNPALVDSLTKSSSFKLEVLSPVKARYRYDAKW